MKSRIWAGLAIALFAASSVMAAESMLKFNPRSEEFKRSGLWWSMSIINPAAPDTDGVHSTVAVGISTASYTFTSAEAIVHTAGVAGRARNITVNFFDNTGANNNGVPNAGTAIVTGKNLLNETITETFTSTDNTANTVTGTQAFKSVTSVACTAGDDAGYCVSIGFGSKFGFPSTLLATTQVLLTDVDGSVDGSATVTADNDEIEKNGITWNTGPNGSRDFQVMGWISPYPTLTSATAGW